MTNELINNLIAILKAIIPDLNSKVARPLVAVSLGFCVAVLDYLYGFTQTYFNQQKIEQLTGIDAILSNPNIDSYYKNEITLLQHEILSKKHIYEKIEMNLVHIKDIDPISNNIWMIHVYNVSLFWMPVSLTFISIITILVSIRNRDFWSILLGSIVMLAVVWGSAILFDTLLNAIPIHVNIEVYFKAISAIIINVILFNYVKNKSNSKLPIKG